MGRYDEQFTTECLLFDIFGRIDLCWCGALAFGDAASAGTSFDAGSQWRWRLAARDLAELGEELLRAAQRRPVRRDWFLYDLPGLRLEDFQPDAGAASHPQVTLRLTRGGVQQLVAKPNPEGAVPVLEDVVLPLRNLSAYLHAMGDRAVPQLGAQASKMTARQIDEFLLAFGGRILEAEQEELLPLHRYWRHG